MAKLEKIVENKLPDSNAANFDYEFFFEATNVRDDEDVTLTDALLAFSECTESRDNCFRKSSNRIIERKVSKMSRRRQREFNRKFK